MILHLRILRQLFRSFLKQRHRFQIGILFVINPPKSICNVWIITLLRSCILSE